MEIVCLSLPDQNALMKNAAEANPENKAKREYQGLPNVQKRYYTQNQSNPSQCEDRFQDDHTKGSLANWKIAGLRNTTFNAQLGNTKQWYYRTSLVISCDVARWS